MWQSLVALVCPAAVAGGGAHLAPDLHASVVHWEDCGSDERFGIV